MSQIGLDDEFIDGLLKEESRPKPDHVPTPIKPRQTLHPEGPVSYSDKEMRCSERRCGSPTYIKVEGLSQCTTHAIRRLNNMFAEAGFRGMR